jgi:hypothetical protein
MGLQSERLQLLEGEERGLLCSCRSNLGELWIPTADALFYKIKEQTGERDHVRR